MAEDGGVIHRDEPKAPEHIYVQIIPDPVETPYIGGAFTSIPDQHKKAGLCFVQYTRAHPPYQEVDAIQDELEL